MCLFHSRQLPVIRIQILIDPIFNTSLQCCGCHFVTLEAMLFSVLFLLVWHSHIPGHASLYSSFIGLTFLLWLVHKGSVLIPSLYLRLNADTVVCCLCGLNSSRATGHAYFTHCTFVDWTFRTYWSCAYTTPSFSDQFQTFACVWLFLTKSRSACYPRYWMIFILTPLWLLALVVPQLLTK